MATSKPTLNSRLDRVVPLSTQKGDSLQQAVNQFLLWEMRSRDCIKVKRCYIDVAADLEAGVLLSQIIYWHLPDKEGEQKLTVQRDGELWLAKAREDWWDECRLTPKQFDRAIRHLEAKQLVCTKVYKWQGQNTKHIRVDWAGLLQALSMLDANTEKVVGFRRRQPVPSADKTQRNESQAQAGELPNSQSLRFPISQSCELPNSQSLDSQLGNSQIPNQAISELPNREIHYIDPEITSETTCKDYSSPLTPQAQQEQVEQVEQLEICLSSLETTNTHPLEKQLESHLSEKGVDVAGTHTSGSQPQVQILPLQSTQTKTQSLTPPSPSQSLDLRLEQTPPLCHTIHPDGVKSDRTKSTDSAPVALAALTKQLKQAEDLRWGKQKTPGKDEQGQWLPEMVEAIYLSSPTHYSIQIGELKGQKNYHHCIKALDRLEREASGGKNEALASLKSFSDNANSLIAQRQRQQELTQAHQMATQVPHFPMMPISWHTQLLQAYKTLGEEAFILREQWHKDWLGYAERYLRQQLLACS